MTFPDALQYLHQLRQFGFQPGLETTRQLAALVGNPHHRLRFIHVAGTNGKGSTCAMLESIYRQTGLKVGLYTSPHLVRFNERIQVNRIPIPDQALAELVEELRDRISSTAPGLEPTFFEFTTIVALRWFEREKCDLVIWETGLGGRLDATNIVTPLANVITNIGLDHQHILGKTVAEIAAEKAGILKREIPATTATQVPEALEVLKFKARELDAPLITLDAAAIQRFALEPSLAGEHQRANAALAAATVRLLRFILPVSDDQLRIGLETAQWPGRLQRLQRGKNRWLLDGAHNLDGIRALTAFLQQDESGQRPTVILGVLADKDWKDMVRELVPLAGRIITAPVGSSRTVPAEELRAACVATGLGRPVKATASVTEALKSAQSDRFVVVTGSLYFIGEVMENLGLEPAAAGEERTLNEWTAVR